MSFTISKTFEFAASHQLAHLPEGHKCARLHGHNYIVRVELEGDTLDQAGFIVDYDELSFVKRYVDERLDHRHLNDVFFFNPTAESMAEFLSGYVLDELTLRGFARQVRVVRVGVSETPKTWATHAREVTA